MTKKENSQYIDWMEKQLQQFNCIGYNYGDDEKGVSFDIEINCDDNI